MKKSMLTALALTAVLAVTPIPAVFAEEAPAAAPTGAQTATPTATPATTPADAQAAAQSNANDQQVRVTVQGKEVVFPDAKPYIDPVTGRTMVPVRFVSEALGAKVEWDGAKRTVRMTATYDFAPSANVATREYQVTLKIGDKKAEVDNRTIHIEQPAVIHDSRTYVPLRFVSESFGQNVEWKKDEKLVVITKLDYWEDRRAYKLSPYDPVSTPLLEQFVANLKIEGNKVTGIMPKLPKGYNFSLFYEDRSDGKAGNRAYDFYNLDRKYKPGEKFSIPFVGQGGNLFAAFYAAGGKGMGSVGVKVPSLDTTWFVERGKK